MPQRGSGMFIISDTKIVPGLIYKLPHHPVPPTIMRRQWGCSYTSPPTLIRSAHGGGAKFIQFCHSLMPAGAARAAKAAREGEPGRQANGCNKKQAVVVADFWPPNGNGNTTGRMNAAEDQPKLAMDKKKMRKSSGETLAQLSELLWLWSQLLQLLPACPPPMQRWHLVIVRWPGQDPLVAQFVGLLMWPVCLLRFQQQIAQATTYSPEWQRQHATAMLTVPPGCLAQTNKRQPARQRQPLAGAFNFIFIQSEKYKLKMAFNAQLCHVEFAQCGERSGRGLFDYLFAQTGGGHSENNLLEFP